jgi:hypothetical protein
MHVASRCLPRVSRFFDISWQFSASLVEINYGTTDLWILSARWSWSWSWIYDRRPVGLSVLVLGSHLGQIIRFLFSVWQLWVSCCERPLWREESYSYNYFSVMPKQSISDPSLAELTNFLIWDSYNLEWQVPVLISPRTRVAQLWSRLLQFAGLRWRYSKLLSHGKFQALKFK